MARRLTTKERGYGAPHRKLKAEWAKRIERGGVGCALCGRVIEPWMTWHLDHDVDRAYYRGPAHEFCNCREPSQRRRRRTSTAWRNPAWA
jgi:hypothetical protein